MLSSRSEYRLCLRQDNAASRMAEQGFKLGLLSESDIFKIRQEKQQILEWIEFSKGTQTDSVLIEKFGLKDKISLYNLLKRPELSSDQCFDSALFHTVSKDILDKAIVEIKYEGYIAKQKREIAKIHRMQSKKIPEAINFDLIGGLKVESREKFKRYKPKTFLDAQKIAGINPTDIGVLMAYLSR